MTAWALTKHFFSFVTNSGFWFWLVIVNLKAKYQEYASIFSHRGLYLQLDCTFSTKHSLYSFSRHWAVALFVRFSVIVITSYMPSCSFTLANYLQTLRRRSVVRLVKAWLNALSSTCRPLDSELQDWHWALDDVDYDHVFNFWGTGVGFKQGNYLHRGSVPKPPNPPTFCTSLQSVVPVIW